jgi:hypothetical protein
MLHYILQITAFQVFFLLVYDLFLKRETFFNYNRLYLLGTALLSMVLPFMKLESVKAVATKDFVIRLPEVIIGKLSEPIGTTVPEAFQNDVIVSPSTLPMVHIIFYGGMALASLFFLSKIIRLYWLKYQNPRKWKGNVLIVKLLKSSAAFSFFNTIFLGEYIPKTEKPIIIKHELVHVEQKHTIDLLFFEVLRILLWFNPLVYMYQNRIKTLHEYIADAHAAKSNGKRDYYKSLLNQVFETNNLSFINTFYKQSLIKKRIVMLQKSKSKQIALIKYALLIPLVFGMLIYTSADVGAQEKETETVVETVVIHEQDFSEKALIEKYYKELKGYSDAGDFKKIMSMTPPSSNKFRMSLDEFARLKATIKAIVNDRIKEKIENGSATDSEIERLNRFESEDSNYLDYIERTKTEDYGRQWEFETAGATLKLFVTDLKNYNKEENERFDKKMALIEKDNYWEKLLISDGNKSYVMTFGGANGEKKPVQRIEEIRVENVLGDIEVPFSVIERVPVFPGCEKEKGNNAKKSCMSDKIAQFVNKNFNTDLATTLGLEGRMRTSVSFKIDKTGYVKSIFARAKHPQLEDEAKRVIRMLPKMKPGMQRGKAVTVPYALPILFQVQKDIKTIKPNRTLVEVEDTEIEHISETIEVPFSKVEVAPTFEACENSETNNERKACTSKTITQFVNKNFNTDLVTALELEGRVRISVAFKIDEEGNIKSVFARAPHPRVEEEAKRVIRMLPKFIPGTQRGKAVTVSYALPILFQVTADKSKDKN